MEFGKQKPSKDHEIGEKEANAECDDKKLHESR
jgi:hypothetical protein